MNNNSMTERGHTKQFDACWTTDTEIRSSRVQFRVTPHAIDGGIRPLVDCKLIVWHYSCLESKYGRTRGCESAASGCESAASGCESVAWREPYAG